MVLKIDISYYRNDKKVTGKLLKSEYSKDVFYDPDNEEYFNSEGFLLEYISSMNTFIPNETVFLIHQDYFFDNPIKNERFYTDLSYNILSEDDDEDNPNLACDCKQCMQFREFIRKDGNHPILANIFIYHEFLLENDTEYKNENFIEFLKDDPYQQAVIFLLGFFEHTYREYEKIRKITGLLIPKHLNNWIVEYSASNEDIKNVVQLVRNVDNILIDGLAYLNKVGLDLDTFSKSNFNNDDNNHSKPSFEDTSKNIRDFDPDVVFDVIDKKILIKTLVKIIRNELNIKVVIVLPQFIKMKDFNNLPLLTNIYNQLVNIYQQSLVSEKGLVIEIKINQK